MSAGTRIRRGCDRERFRGRKAERPARGGEPDLANGRAALAGKTLRDRDVFGVIIESKEVSETQRQIFEMAWRYAAMTTPKEAGKLGPFKRRRYGAA